MSLTILDLIVIGAVVLSALLAAVRGFTREVLSIASWVAAAVAAWSLHPMLLPFVQQHVKQDTIALVIAIAAILLVTLVIVSLITARISDFVLDSRIGALDRTEAPAPTQGAQVDRAALQRTIDNAQRQGAQPARP